MTCKKTGHSIDNIKAKIMSAVRTFRKCHPTHTITNLWPNFSADAPQRAHTFHHWSLAKTRYCSSSSHTLHWQILQFISYTSCNWQYSGNLWGIHEEEPDERHHYSTKWCYVGNIRGLSTWYRLRTYYNPSRTYLCMYLRNLRELHRIGVQYTELTLHTA